jgi:ribose transport system permease protein
MELNTSTSRKLIFNPTDIILNNLSLLLLITMVVIGALFSENFLTTSNALNVLKQVSINGVLAAGFTLVFLAGGFDLSMGSVVSICAVVAIGTLNATGSTSIAIITVMCVGLAFGFLNGQLIKLIKGDLSDTFLVTLGTSLLASSLAYTYSGGFNIYVNMGASYREIGRGSILGFPILAISMIAVMAVFQFLLKRTSFGRKIYSTGGNNLASYMSGVNTHRIRTITFMISGLCASIAAVMMTARTGVASPSTGYGYEFDAAIACIIGGNREGSITGNIVKTLIGVLILGLITNIMNLMNINSVIQMIVKGIILLLALSSDKFKKSF